VNIPNDLSYAATHEWLHRTAEGIVIGITDYAQGELTDIVFVDLPEVGRRLNAGDEICALESVKAVAYVYAPVAGTIAAVNEKLKAAPELVNQQPYDEGWIIRLIPDQPEKAADLMDATAYRARVEAAASSH
jgi:glycine cleavage system H protein